MSTPFGGNQEGSAPGPGLVAGAAGYPQPGYGETDYSQVQPHYGTPIGEQAVTLASWGQRLGAVLLDGVVLFALQLAVMALAAGVSAVSEVLGTVVMVVGYLGSLIWFMLLEAGPYGQTPGKAAVKIRVRKADGRMLSKGAAVGRYFGKLLSALPLYLGYLWPLWDSENRTFHDMIVNSRVVSAPDTPRFGEVIKGPFSSSRT